MIEQYEFGKIVVDGEQYTQDIKIIDGSVIPDWWREDGHSLTTGDVQDILQAGPDILVVGTGYYGNMKPEESFRESVKDKGIELIEKKSGEAVQTFNELQETGKKVAAGFHLTC